MNEKAIRLPELLLDPRISRILKEIQNQGGRVRTKDLTNKLKELQMAKQTLFNNLDKLVAEELLSHKYDTSERPPASIYELTPKAKELIKPSEEIVTMNDIIGTWPMLLETHFPYPVEGLGMEPEEIPYEEHALAVSVHYREGLDDLGALYRKRMQEADEALIRGILGIAKARGLLDPEHFTGKKGWHEIPLEKWKQLFSELFQDTEEVVYIEHLGVHDLLVWLRQPSVGKYLKGLSSKDPSVPDYTSFLKWSKAKGELKAP